MNDEYAKKVLVVHGVQCMLDVDLAKIFGCSLADLHAKVEDKSERFTGFRFQLTQTDMEELSLPSGDSLPWCFTEEGIYLLCMILDLPTAIEYMITFLRDFPKIKNLLTKRQFLIGQREQVLHSVKLTDDLDEIMRQAKTMLENHRQMQETLLEISRILQDSPLSSIFYAFGNPTEIRSYVIVDGVAVSEDFAYEDLFATARHSLCRVDYRDKTPFLRPLVPAKEAIEDTLSSEADFYIVINHETPWEQTFLCTVSRKNHGFRIASISTVENNAYMP